MNDINYVIRYFLNDRYSHSIHCSGDILDEMIKRARDAGYTIKIVAFTNNGDSEEV